MSLSICSFCIVQLGFKIVRALTEHRGSSGKELEVDDVEIRDCARQSSYVLPRHLPLLLLLLLLPPPHSSIGSSSIPASTLRRGVGVNGTHA
jgi:hypothetical protein